MSLVVTSNVNISVDQALSHYYVTYTYHQVYCRQFPHWNVYISPKLTDAEYAEGKVNELLKDNPNVKYSEDLHLGVKKLSAMYCHGRSDNPWIDTYRIHRDEDDPNQEIVLQMISKNS